MSEIGVNLGDFRKKGLLEFLALRSTSHGFEAHLALIHKLVDRFQPTAVILDPIGTFLTAGEEDCEWPDAEALYIKVRDTAGEESAGRSSAHSESSVC